MDKMKLKENFKKIQILSGIGLSLILLMGVSFAFFAMQGNGGLTTLLDVKTGTTDVLTFSFEDIDVTDNKRNDYNDDTILNIEANQDNLSLDSLSLGDGVKIKASLRANNETNVAHMTYNLYINISINEFIHTDGETPEILLTVNGPDGEVKDITGLNYYSDVNGFSGFDITQRTGNFALKLDQEIDVIEADEGIKEQTWNVAITFVNLATNQEQNADKNVSGNVTVTQKTEDSYALAQVTDGENLATANTIELKPKFIEGTEDIVKYYYAIEKDGTSSVALEIDDTLNWIPSDSPTHLFESLQPNTDYILYAYVVDSLNFASEVYKTKIRTAYVSPAVNSA